MSPVPQQLPSRVLGRYAMYEQFASGGMASLHYGRLLGPAGFSRTVAIKRLHGHLAEDPEFVAMFLDEARLAARIHHPNVIQTLDVESSEGELFVVLNYVHGDSLSQLLTEARRAGTPPTPALIGTILFGALEGLHAAHEARDAKGEPLDLVHRDVSPHNVLVGTDGIPRVLDFGVAKARGRAQTTRAGQLKGKLAYMAPEQLRGKATRRSDVFAASIVLWEALTGTRLFRGDDDGDVIHHVLHEPIPSPRKLAPQVSPALEAVVMRGLERDPTKRFATAREMAIALEAEVTLATPIEVGGFVELVGGARLAQRAARVAVIEAECGDALDPHGAGDPSAAASTVRPRAPSHASATSPTVAVAGLARVARQEAPTTVDGAESAATGIATVSETHPPSRRRIGGVLRVAAVIGAVAAVGLGVAASAGNHERTRAPSDEATTPAPAAPVLPAPAPSAPQEDPAPSAETPEARPTAADPQIKKTPAPHPHARPGCSPAYTIDARGVRHYKPECI